MDKKTAVYDRLKINNDQNLTIPETASLFCSGGAVFRKGVAIGDNDSIIPGTLRYNDNTLQVRKFEDWKTITTQQGTGEDSSIVTFNEDGEIQGSDIKIENNQLLGVDQIEADLDCVNIPKVNVGDKLIIPYGTISNFNSKGEKGQVTFDDKYLYLCIDDDKWSRIQIENSYSGVKAVDGCLVTLYKKDDWSSGVTLDVYINSTITIYTLGVQDTTSFYVKNGDKIYFKWTNTGLAPWELKYGSTTISGIYGENTDPISVTCDDLKVFNFQFTKTSWDPGISLDIYINDVKTGEITATKSIITMKNGDKIRFVWFGCGNAPWELSGTTTIESGDNGDRTENLLIDEFYASC
jgi:hypothetical protein